MRPRTAAVRQIFSSFDWTAGLVDPALVRAWDAPSEPVDPASAQGRAGETADRWVFSDDGRLRRAAAEPVAGGFYSSSGGVLNIVWDHGLEESYLYTVSKRPEGGSQLELKSPAGDALRLY